MTSTYDRVARGYDLLGTLYSGGAIRRSKAAHLAWLEGGKRVLYAGAGTAGECVQAHARGAQVTVSDASAKMLTFARRRFDEIPLSEGRFPVEFLPGDVRYAKGQFDVVVAPYFLNVFSRKEIGGVIAGLAARLASGGQLIVVDFRGPSSRRLFHLFQRLYYFFPQILFLLLTKNPWHELYDYEKLVKEGAPSLTLTKRVCTRAFGLPLFETLCFEKARSS